MNIEQLQYICMVAKTNSITSAAEKLFVTQQTISKAISKLENELDTKLLIRSYKGVKLTFQGQRFIEQAQIIVDEFDQLYSTMKQQKPAETLDGQLSLSATPYLMYTVIPNLLIHFHHLFPKIKIHIDERLTKDILANIEAQGDKIGFIALINDNTGCGRLNSYVNTVYWEHIAQDKLLAYVSKDNPLSKKSFLSLRELKDHPIVLGGCPGFETILQDDYDVNPMVAINSSNGQIHSRAVAQSKMIGFTTQRVMNNNDLSDCTVIQIKEKPKLNILMVRAKNYKPTQQEIIWIDEMKKKFLP